MREVCYSNYITESICGLLIAEAIVGLNSTVEGKKSELRFTLSIQFIELLRREIFQQRTKFRPITKNKKNAYISVYMLVIIRISFYNSILNPKLLTIIEKRLSRRQTSKIFFWQKHWNFSYSWVPNQDLSITMLELHSINWIFDLLPTRHGLNQCFEILWL